MIETYKRGKGVDTQDYTTYDIFLFYKETCPKEFRVSRKDFSKIITVFTKELRRRVIEESLVAVLPFNLGRFFIKVYDPPTVSFDEKGNIDLKNSSISVDFKATKELWAEDPELKKQKKLCFHENEHTFGKRVKIYWEPGKVRNIEGYTFVPCREFKRSLAQYTKSNPNLEYYDI